MSRILVTTETQPVKVESRTWRVQIFTDFGRDPHIEFLREKVTYVADEVKGSERSDTVTTTLSAIAARTVTLHDGTVLTGLQLAEAVAAVGDMLEEDKEKAQAPVQTTTTPSPLAAV